MVAISGRKSPVAAAQTATVPDGSAVGVALTAHTTPDVPIEMITSPALAPTPRAEAALSPLPGPRTARACVPAAAAGASTVGTTGCEPSASCNRSGRYELVDGD